MSTNPGAPDEQRTCACGRQFTCDLAAGKATCWCAALPPVLPVPDAAAACLCPDCLRQAIAVRTAAIGRPADPPASS